MAYDLYLHQVFLYFPDLEQKVVDYRQYKGLLLKLYTNTDTDYFYDLATNVLYPIPKDTDNLTKDQFLRIFGIVMRNAIRYSGLTQEEIAKKTGFKQSQISDYLYGRHTPSFYAVYKISKAIGCSLEDLGYVK